jgi:ubiquinone/menaquinone biosynthesis C-methylase UbiE
MDNSIVDKMKAMGDPTRLRLLALLQDQELTVGSLVEILLMAQSGISRHLKVLLDARLVELRRAGTSSYYRIADEIDDDILNYLGRVWASDDTFQADRIKRKKVLDERRKKALTYFESVADEWDEITSSYFPDESRRDAALALLDPKATIVDIGCGTGKSAAMIAPFVGKVIGIDHSRAMLAKAKERAKEIGVKNVDFRVADWHKLPLKANSADAAWSTMALHHEEDPTILLKELVRVVKPGGVVLIVDLRKHDYDWLRDEMHDVWLGFEEADIKRFFRKSGLSDPHYINLSVCRGQSETRQGAKAEIDTFMARGTVKTK